MKKILLIPLILLAGCQMEQTTGETLYFKYLQKFQVNIEKKQLINFPRISEEEIEMTEDGQIIYIVENPDSIEVVVNKERKLPDGFVPPNLVEPNVPFPFSEPHEKRLLQKVAAEALEELFAAAKEEGYDLFAVSGYRSYERQQSM